MNVRIALVAVTAALFVVASARAAETDPYYAWRHPPRDSTVELNKSTNRVIDATLANLNGSFASARLSCADVAGRLSLSLRRTGLWYWVGALDDFGLHAVPRSNTEYRTEYAPHSMYRYSYLWKWGFIVPVDPTILVAGVNLSPDKLGHFFIDGMAYYTRFHEALDAGLDEHRAHEAAIEIGIEDESWIQGDLISGIFSYADLEANEQGFHLYRDLCDGEEPLLVRDDDGWRMQEPLDFRDYVNPCWDEAYYTSAFDRHVGQGVKRALREDYCELRYAPHVVERMNRYDERGCTSFSFRYLQDLAARGVIPSRRPYTLDAICAETTEASR